MDFSEDLRPGGSGILPEETSPKFFARHLSAYHFVMPYYNNKEVLEIGFGDGYGSNFLAQYAKSVKAVDVLERNVHLAKSKYKMPNLEFMHMSGIELDFKSESFDVVISFQVIEHLLEDDIPAYLKAIRNVLRPSGLGFISTLNLDKNRKPNKPYTKNPFHIKEFTYKEFDSAIKKVFSEYEIYGMFYTKRLKFYERLKKIGIFRLLPRSLDIVDTFYRNITVRDFIWKKEDLTNSIDFMAVCKKG